MTTIRIITKACIALIGLAVVLAPAASASVELAAPDVASLEFARCYGTPSVAAVCHDDPFYTNSCFWYYVAGEQSYYFCFAEESVASDGLSVESGDGVNVAMSHNNCVGLKNYVALCSYHHGPYECFYTVILGEPGNHVC